MHQKETWFTCTCIVLYIASLNLYANLTIISQIFIHLIYLSLFLTVICLRFVLIVKDQTLEIIS